MTTTPDELHRRAEELFEERWRRPPRESLLPGEVVVHEIPSAPGEVLRISTYPISERRRKFSLRVLKAGPGGDYRRIHSFNFALELLPLFAEGVARLLEHGLEEAHNHHEG